MALNSGYIFFNHSAEIAMIIASVRNYTEVELEVIYMTDIASFTVLSHMHGEGKKCD
jgi:hypothetical protein